MENLFTTSVNVERQTVKYLVQFDHENYHFIAQDIKGSYPDFSLRREHDEWVLVNPLPEEVKKQAVDALEGYLLRQH